MYYHFTPFLHVILSQELGQNYYKCLQELTNIQSVVLDQELASWKRMQRLCMCGQEESPNKKEVIDQLQQWCEQLADLLWRNRMQIIQVHSDACNVVNCCVTYLSLKHHD